jgi:UDP-sulfoquinovose synthase
VPDIKILILGGDGFCGWPTSLHLSAPGHEVTIVDNVSRRNIDNEFECESLTPIRPMGERLHVWEEVSDCETAFHNFNVARNYQRLLDLLNDWRLHAIMHFAEQRAVLHEERGAKFRPTAFPRAIRSIGTLAVVAVEGCLSNRSGDASVAS